MIASIVNITVVTTYIMISIVISRSTVLDSWGSYWYSRAPEMDFYVRKHSIPVYRDSH